jgi:hypothetical protein
MVPFVPVADDMTIIIYRRLYRSHYSCEVTLAKQADRHRRRGFIIGQSHIYFASSGADRYPWDSHVVAPNTSAAAQRLVRHRRPFDGNYHCWYCLQSILTTPTNGCHGPTTAIFIKDCCVQRHLRSCVTRFFGGHHRYQHRPLGF